MNINYFHNTPWHKTDFKTSDKTNIPDFHIFPFTDNNYSYKYVRTCVKKKNHKVK